MRKRGVKIEEKLAAKSKMHDITHNKMSGQFPVKPEVHHEVY